MALLIAFALILTAQPIGVQAETVFEQGQSYALENIIEIPVWDEEGELSIGLTTIGDPGSNPEPDGGPSSYDILPNGDVLVVDTYDDPSPIVQYSSDGKYILTIPAEVFSDSKSGVSAIIVNSGRLYVLTNDYTLCEYDLETEEVVKHEIPEGVFSYSGRGSVNIDEYIVFTSYDENDEVWAFDTEHSTFILADNLYTYEYNEETNTNTIKFGTNEYVIPGHIGITPLGVDNSGNLYVECFQGFDVGLSYRKYSKQGDLIAFAEETYDDQELYLFDIVRVVDGELIRAKCDENTYALDRVVFNETYYTEQPFDLNFDNLENTGDAVLLLRYCADFEEFDPALVEKADINKDLKVNTGDVIAILKHIVD